MQKVIEKYPHIATQAKEKYDSIKKLDQPDKKLIEMIKWVPTSTLEMHAYNDQEIMSGVQEGVKEIHEMTPLQKLWLCSDMMRTYGFNPIDPKKQTVKVSLDEDEAIDSKSIDMDAFDLF